MHRTLGLLLVAGLVLNAVSASAADGKPVPASKKSRAKAVAEVTAEQQAGVRAFLQQHHAELADLLGHLQRARPAEYARAVRDIWHAAERLRQFEKGDRDRYELELQSWVVQSKIQLLAARLAIQDSPTLREELRHLLADQLELKMRLAQMERERTAERLRRIDEQLQRLTNQRTEILEREFSTVTKNAERLKVKRKELFEHDNDGSKM